MQTDTVTQEKIDRCRPGAYKSIVDDFRDAAPRERMEYLLNTP